MLLAPKSVCQRLFVESMPTPAPKPPGVAKLLIALPVWLSLYILFSCYVRLGVGATEATILILIDEIPEMYFLITRTTSTATERIPLAMQYGKSMISSGTHNVSVWGYSNIDFQECFRCGLLVQTYK